MVDAVSTLAQRIVRAKAKIRDARIPYEVAGARRASPAKRRDLVLLFTITVTYRIQVPLPPGEVR